jgi:ubiquinone/menaquinone biosynthesis C-methylase UbiE
MGCRPIGLDWSAEALRIAAGRATEAGVEVDWREGSALALPLEDESIDFVVDNGCLHGIPLDDWPLYAAEVVRVLVPGGRFLLAGGASEGEAARVAITESHIESAFGALFERGPLTPVIARSDAGELEANMCLMVRR